MVSKKEKSYLTYLVLATVAILLAHQFSLITIPNFPRWQTTATHDNDDDTPIDTSMRANYLKGIGKFEIASKGADSCAITTARTLATNFDVVWYGYYGGRYTGAVTETAGTDYFDMKPEYGGIAHVAIIIPSAQAFYVDYKKMSQEDPYIRGYKFLDVDGDSSKEFVFEYDMRNQAIPSSGYPVAGMSVYLITYDASFTGLNDLANDTGIGQTTNTVYYEWYLAHSAEKKGTAIYKVELKVGTTDETKIRLEKFEIPTMGYLDDTSFDKQITDSSIVWSYTICQSTFDGALYLTRPVGSSNKLYMNCQLEYTLANSDDILVTLTVYYLAAQTGAGASKTDTFYAQE